MSITDFIINRKYPVVIAADGGSMTFPPKVFEQVVSDYEVYKSKALGIPEPYFTITTNPETAALIKKECERLERTGGRSFVLSGIRTEKGSVSDYSVVHIKPRNGKIDPSDIFFLGLFSAHNQS